MAESTRVEYPSMLAALQPNQAVQTLNDRVKRINRINGEIADWLQERRRVEEQYVMGLRRLGQFKVPNAQSELGVFSGPWSRMIDAIEAIAHSHQQFASRVDMDVEQPLRAFSQREDAANITTMASNLSTMAKTLEEAQHASEKLGKKGGKANSGKMDAAASKLESATQQWESQAPYIFESLQALDESRINQLRDLLTQYQTHEADCAQRTLDNSADALAQVLEVSTETEIMAFSNKVTAGKGRLPMRPSTRRSSNTETQNSAAPSTGASTNLARPTSAQATPASETTPTPSETNHTPFGPSSPAPAPEPKETPKPESKLRRLGTILGGRRRQSVHGGVGPSPQKDRSSTFGRLGSKEGRSVSPRGSLNNLRESSRLGAVAEAPTLSPTRETNEIHEQKEEQVNTNGATAGDANIMDSPVPGIGINGTHESSSLSQDAPTASQGQGQHTTGQAQAPTKDAEGFTIPAAANDPISAAQREAAASGEDADQLFKLNIQNKPVDEEDPEAKMAALSSVANSLRAGPAVRRSGTLRGRRDVRNTIYAPSPNVSTEGQAEAAGVGLSGSPSLPTSFASQPTVAALATENSVTAASDTQSVRSGTSLGSLAQVKHPEMTAPGLNSSIIETVSAVFEGGAVTSASISGEIAFVNNTSDENMFKTHENIRINNFTSLDKIGPNRIFVQNYSPDHPDQFSLDISHLTKMSTAFSYRVFASDADAAALGRHAPLMLNPAWKPQGDKLGLLIQYQLNPGSAYKAPLTLHNVVFVATYEGKASGAQTKPSGTHLKERHLVYWRLGDVTLTNETQKIVCRIIGAEGVEPAIGHVEARWEYAVPAGEPPAGSGISISKLEETKGKGKEITEDDPFADEGATGDGAEPDQRWVDVPLTRKLVSGRFEGK